jgi:hypothetical protein
MIMVGLDMILVGLDKIMVGIDMIPVGLDMINKTTNPLHDMIKAYMGFVMVSRRKVTL